TSSGTSDGAPMTRPSPMRRKYTPRYPGSPGGSDTTRMPGERRTAGPKNRTQELSTAVNNFSPEARSESTGFRSSDSQVSRSNVPLRSTNGNPDGPKGQEGKPEPGSCGQGLRTGSREVTSAGEKGKGARSFGEAGNRQPVERANEPLTLQDLTNGGPRSRPGPFAFPDQNAGRRPLNIGKCLTLSVM